MTRPTSRAGGVAAYPRRATPALEHPKSYPTDEAIPREQVRELLVEAAARQVFDTEAAAGYLGVSRQLLELMRVAGGGPRYAKLGRLVRYRRAALDGWLIERERTNTAAPEDA